MSSYRNLLKVSETLVCYHRNNNAYGDKHDRKEQCRKYSEGPKGSPKYLPEEFKLLIKFP